MPKHGFLTAKAIGNRIKSKGMQKLRWYCQVCAKQCRDENGYKCHTETEAHQRQLLIVGEDPEKFIGGFSDEFEQSFMTQLKRTKGTKRTHANHFYQEYIAYKEHTHMNSTRWRTLTEFVQHIGKKGLAIVDETPKGWYIQYIDRDPEVLRRQADLEKRMKHDKDDEERQAKVMEEQINKGKLREHIAPTEAPTALLRDDNSDPMKFALDTTVKATMVDVNIKKTFKEQLLKVGSSDVSQAFKSKPQKRKKTALELIKEGEEARKQRKVESEVQKKAESMRKDYWLDVGIVVKIMNKKLSDGKFYKCKGVVKEVVKKYGAKIQLLDSKTLITLDQNDLETVIPKVGGAVLIVNGENRGLGATLLSINTDEFACTVELEQGARKGLRVSRIPYEDVCKLH